MMMICNGSVLNFTYINHPHQASTSIQKFTTFFSLSKSKARARSMASTIGSSINKSSIVKPSSSSSSSITTLELHDQNPNSNNSSLLVPLTIFDKEAIDLHFVVLFAFKPPMPSNEVMKEALSRVLHHYPHLAGRFTIDELGRSCIHLNNAGARVIETNVPAILEDQLPLDPSSEVSHLLPPIEEHIEDLFQIQLNRYDCGGLTIGVATHHHVADGTSMSSFFVAWAKMVRGIDLHPLPYLNRGSVSVPRNPPRIEFDHRSIELEETSLAPTSVSSFENLVTHYSNEFVNELKAKVIEDNSTPYQRYSTFECLLAHVWKKVTQARELDLEESTIVKVAVNGRARMNPPVSMEYFGNLVMWAYPKLKVKEVVNESHAYIARTIHEEVSKINNKYFLSFIDYKEITKGDIEEKEHGATAPKMGNLFCPNLEVDSWLTFEFSNLDFGGGSPCAFFPPNLPTEGILVFLPSCRESGGVDVVMTLLPEHVPLFRQISHSLD